MRRVTIWFGLALGIGLCLYFLSRMDWPTFFHHLRTLYWPPVLVMLGAILCGTVFRAARWMILTGGRPWHTGGLDFPVKSLRLGRFWRAVVVGYLGNYVYPAKAGEMLRIAYLHRVTGLPVARVLTSYLFDRSADVLLLATCGVILVWLGIAQGDPGPALLAVAGVIVVAVFGLALILRFNEAFRTLLQYLISLVRFRWQERCARWADQLMDGLALLRNPLVIGGALGSSMAAVAMDITAYWMLLSAFGWNLPIAASLELFVSFGLGACLPAAPGYLGIFQAAAVLVLGKYGIAETGALAFAFTLQGLSLCLFLITAGGALWRKGHTKSTTTTE